MDKRSQTFNALLVFACVVFILFLIALLAPVADAPLVVAPFTSPVLTPSSYQYLPLIVCDEDCVTVRPTLPGPTSTPTARPTP